MAIAFIDSWIAELQRSCPSSSTVIIPSSNVNVYEYVDGWIAELSLNKPRNMNELAQSKHLNTTPISSSCSSPNEVIEAASASLVEVHAGMLEFRVGRIIDAWPHPESEKLYCEKIDVGESGPRLIASGLRNFYKIEELQGRKCIVVCNLKGKKMGNFKSEGMVMCSSNDTHDDVHFVEPPPGAPIGSLVTFEGLDSAPVSSAQVVKRKILESCLADLHVGVDGVCLFKDKPFTISGFGVCTSPVASGYHIS
jgi:methionine--tRNA ligase beta chain